MIRFETDDLTMPPMDRQEVTRWILQIAASYGKKTGEINYVFCSDPKMLEANIKHLGHDYYTDIITFDYSEPEKIAGDIYIGAETVASNALLLGLSPDMELLRVIIHGILHLCGFKDKTPEAETIMHEQEDLALKYFYQIVK
jgi:probable rRNA maturation factor